MNYQPITSIKPGQEFCGQTQEYFKVRDIYDGEATIYCYAGDAHRYERGPIDAMIDRLNAALDHTDNHDEYWTKDHPEVRLVAAYPDDPDYKDPMVVHVGNKKFAIIDQETGEVLEQWTDEELYNDWALSD